MEKGNSLSGEESAIVIQDEYVSEQSQVIPTEWISGPRVEVNSEMIYQVVKLNKALETTTHEGKTYKALKSVNGLSCVAPDTRFIENSVLKDLIASANGPLHCEFLIVITMYNEKIDELKNTLDGVKSNLKSFVQNDVQPQQYACIVIIDGVEAFFKTYDSQKEFFIKYCNKQNILDRFPEAGGDVRNCQIPEGTDDDEFAHLFMQKIRVNNKNELDLQLIFCIKQKNKRKLNTHLWFFGGFCQMIQPKYVMLLDVGTKPLDNSLYYLYKAMENDVRVAGCCGEIEPMSVDGFNLVVPAQMDLGLH
ncbi:unnamed protein product [Blepharisma stoltei]|uniref:chitin synthase n=1 Tax=Blepharisma stoltei TaxID=1481888 RepID=A0AAU9JFY4_9CILI|nr:unnamed protein product [Blepharisma stoltei]